MKMMRKKKAVLTTVRRLPEPELWIEANHLIPTLETVVRPKGVSEPRFLMMVVAQVVKMTEAAILKKPVMTAGLMANIVVETLVIREEHRVIPIVLDATMVADIQEAQVVMTETTIVAPQGVTTVVDSLIEIA